MELPETNKQCVCVCVCVVFKILNFSIQKKIMPFFSTLKNILMFSSSKFWTFLVEFIQMDLMSVLIENEISILYTDIFTCVYDAYWFLSVNLTTYYTKFSTVFDSSPTFLLGFTDIKSLIFHLDILLLFPNSYISTCFLLGCFSSANTSNQRVEKKRGKKGERKFMIGKYDQYTEHL